MARVAIRSVDSLGLQKGTVTLYAGDKDPIHLHVHRLESQESMTMGSATCDSAAYVLSGRIIAGGVMLQAGSSLVVERGASLTISAGSEGAQLLVFHATQPPQEQRAGGHVHLMPQDRVPRYTPEPAGSGAGGGLHFNAECPGCTVWLHENHLPGVTDEDAQDAAERGIHSHSVDEIIFITAGSMRLGARVVGFGTALAIAADTFYNFTPGPQGVSFINFRPGFPANFRLKNGGTFDEAGYWRDRVAVPCPLSPMS